MKKVKVLTAEEAAMLVKDGDTVATGGFVGSGNPESLTGALEKRFLETGKPEKLVLFHAAGQGNDGAYGKLDASQDDDHRHTGGQEQVRRVLTQDIEHIVRGQKRGSRRRENYQKDTHCKQCNDDTDIVFEIFDNSITKSGCHIFSSFALTLTLQPAA